jgi:hypothetical protein
MKVVATSNVIQLEWDGQDVNGGAPIIDTTDPLMSGNVGCYNFSAASGEVPVYFDDLQLTNMSPTALRGSTWGAIKKLYR